MASNNRNSGLAVSAAGESAVLYPHRWARVLAQACGILVIGIGLLAITGWLSGNHLLSAFGANLYAMAPRTTIAFLAYGASLLLLASSGKWRYKGSITLVVIGLTMALSRLVEYAIHVEFGFIEEQLPPIQEAFSLAPVGRMAFMTAICFVLTAGAVVGLLFAQTTRAIRFATAGLATAVLVVGVTFLLGYAYGLPLLRNTSSVPMALNTSIAFLLLGIGLSALGIGYEIAERRRGTDSLSLLATIIESSHDAIISFTPAGIIRTWNAAAGSMYGYTAEEAIGQPINIFSLPECLALSQASVESLSHRERITAYQTTLKHKYGRLITVSVSAFPLYDAHGRIIASAAILRDITEHKRAELEITNFFRLSVNMLCIANLEGYFVKLNPNWEMTLGFTLEELTAKPFIEFVHPDDRQATIAQVRKLAANKDVVSFENRYLCKDGSYKTLLWNSTPSVELGLIYATAVDITERKQAEAKLALDVVRTQTLLDLHQINSPPPEQLLDFVLEASLKVTQSELSFVGLLDETESVMTIHRWSNRAMAQCATSEKPLVYPLCAAGLWGDCVRQRQPLVINDFAAPHPGKKDLPAGHVPIRRFLAVPVFDGEHIVAVAAVANKAEPYATSDIRALTSLMNKLWLIVSRKKAEEAIQRLNADLSRQSTALQAANKELEAFSYSVSHDLRAPLRAIGGFSQILLEDHAAKLDEDGKACLGRISKAANDMGILIDDMLTLSRVTRKEMRRETVDLSAIAAKIVDDLRKLHPEREVEFVIADGMRIAGDLHLLRVALENLSHNAWKYTSRHRTARIEIGTEEQDGQTVFYVRDDGAGFNMKYADKLFKPFQRLHSTDEFEGSGIGLATVQRVINRHGGRVWATGAVEQGATFYFTCEPQEVFVHA